MKSIRAVFSEWLSLSLLSGLFLAGWQTGVSVETMKTNLDSFPIWIHFAIYSLGGTILFFLFLALPALIAAIILSLIKKEWASDSIRNFLLGGTIGLFTLYYSSVLKPWLPEPLMIFSGLGMFKKFMILTVIVIVFLFSWLFAGGILKFFDSRDSRVNWLLAWGWWLFIAVIAPIGGKFRSTDLGKISWIIIGILALLFLCLLLKFLPRIYSWLVSARTKRLWAGAIVLVLFFILTNPLPRSEKKGEPADEQNPPVILITVDTLRPDAITCYPEKLCLRFETPNFDRIANEGILFEDAYATAPWTRPSVPSFLSGLPPSANGAFSDESGTLASGATTIAEIFQESGYITSGIVVNHILRDGSGNEQGFDLYYEEMSEQEEDRKLIFQKFIDRYRLTWPEIFSPNNNPFMERDAIRRAQRFVSDHRGEKFFLWIHLLAPHTLFYPPKEYRDRIRDEWEITPPLFDILSQHEMKDGWPAVTHRRFDELLGLYAGEVSFSDDNLGDFFGTLDQLDLFDESVIVVSSDHGEEFFEHDRFTHGRSLFPEVLRVPLLIRLPGGASAGTRIAQPVSLIDLAPTILDLAGVDAELKGEPAIFTGHSLTPLIFDGQYVPRPIFFERPLNFDQELKGILLGSLYYIGGNDAVLHPRMYDLSTDPETYVNLLPARPDVAEMFVNMLRDYDLICDEIADRIGATRDEVDIEQLRALGYIN